MPLYFLVLRTFPGVQNHDQVQVQPTQSDEVTPQEFASGILTISTKACTGACAFAEAMFPCSVSALPCPGPLGQPTRRRRSRADSAAQGRKFRISVPLLGAPFVCRTVLSCSGQPRTKNSRFRLTQTDSVRNGKSRTAARFFEGCTYKRILNEDEH